MDKLYEISLDSADALETSMWLTYKNASKFLGIRTAMDGFLLNLAFSHRAASKDRQIHYLFMALLHLDNVEKEILTSDIEDQILRLEKIIDRIRSLRQLILEYIRYLTEPTGQLRGTTGSHIG
jgi:hypothetical protein